MNFLEVHNCSCIIIDIFWELVVMLLKIVKNVLANYWLDLKEKLLIFLTSILTIGLNPAFGIIALNKFHSRALINSIRQIY